MKRRRYQHGCLYEDHGAWYVRYRDRVLQNNGSIKVMRTSKHLGRCTDFSHISEVKQCRASFMWTVNRDRLDTNRRLTLAAFVEAAYLPWIKAERRASTSARYQGIWRKHLCNRVGGIRMGEFRTVDASQTLRAIAKEKNLTRGTLRGIKSVLSTIFTYAKNEGAFDGANPVEGALIPNNTREAGETHAYDLDQVVKMLEILPPSERSLVATAAFAGLRKGELRGLEWADYTANKLMIKRSIWKSVSSPPKTRASRDAVPVIPLLARILHEYRRFVGNPEAGAIFHIGSGRPINLDNLVRRVIRPALEKVDLPWHGWHAFRRGLASTLYAMGAQDKVVQRILRHARPHVTKECYIKVFESTVLEAMGRLQVRIEELEQAKLACQQLRLDFGDSLERPLSGPAERAAAACELPGIWGLASNWPAPVGKIRAKLLKPNAGEVAERLKAAVC